MDYGLSTLFRNNPHEKRAGAMANVAPQSGYAKPLLMGMMGKEMKAAEDFDESRAGLLAEQHGKDQAMKMLSSIIAISQHDAPTATKMLKAEAAKNPHLEALKDIEFRSETKKDWMSVNTKDGAYMVYLPKLQEVLDNPNDKALKDKYIVEIGKNEKDAKTETFEVDDKGNKTPGVKHRWRINHKTGEREKYLGPADTDTSAGSGTRTIDKVVKDIRDTADKIGKALGDPSLVDALLEGKIDDKAFKRYIEDKKKKDPYIADMATALLKYKQEYEARTDRPWKNDKNTGGFNATLDGNNVIVNGKKYPLNADGTVTIDGKSYKVK